MTNRQHKNVKGGLVQVGFKVGDKVRRKQTGNGGTQIVPVGTLGEVVRVGQSIDVLFEEWAGCDNLQRTQNYGKPEQFVEKVEVKTKLKTWEMLREIKEGDFWKADYNDASLILADGCLRWTYNGTVRVATLDTGFMNAEWEKQPKLVDFPEAWKAYEEGKTIRPGLEQFGYYKPSKGSETSVFTPAEIRGKWQIIE